MNKKYFAIIILLFCTMLWVYNSYKYQLDTNELCKNSLIVKGWVNEIERDNLNSGNISTWIVYYQYLVNGKQYEGKKSFGDKVSFVKGDSITIIYSKSTPQNSQLIAKKSDIKCVSFLQSMLKKWYYIIIGLIFIIVTYGLKNDMNRH